MSTKRIRFGIACTTALCAIIAFSGCATNNPLGDKPETDSSAEDTIVVGSQAYYSNEIIAEIYAQALENDGFIVERQFNIGQRDAYMPELTSGAITLFPEYSGNLLQYFDAETSARSADDVYAALKVALPENLAVLNPAAASDQDSYTVTKAFANEHGTVSIADLANVSVPLTLGGPPELAERPYGPKGLKDTYGINVAFSGTADTTVEDLLAGTINIANVYTADPRIQTDDLVVLSDPQALFLASNVVPVVNADMKAQLADTVNAVSNKLSPEGLIALNVLSTVDQQSAPDIARQWLTEHGLS